jgi:hypothetical protein
MPAEARNLAALELIYTDLSEINGVLTKCGKRYFMTLIDYCTRFCYVYLLKSKDKVLHYFSIHKYEIENQLERKIKRVHYDRGGEYFSNEFSEFCVEYGIILERTPPYSFCTPLSPLSLSPIGYVLTLQPPSVTINIYSCPLLQRVPSSSYKMYLQWKINLSI